MATDAPPLESHSSGSQIHPLLRQRMLNRAATFSEGAHSASPPLPRRRNSALSDYSDTRHSFRSSTDNLLRPAANNDMDKLASSDEPSFWHSAPLAFAILPAAGGLVFQNGGAIVTDILLLAFSSMFLNKCVRAPWDWYHSAQQIQYEPDDLQPSDTIPEEDEESEVEQTEETRATPEPPPSEAPTTTDKGDATPLTPAQRDARHELGREELFALAACFIGPLFGAYLLHTIRSQLTRPAEGLVSNYNLTIFVMAAELRPVSHIIKLKQARMLHLQRIVRAGKDGIGKAGMQEISKRLSSLEERVAEPVHHSDIETMKLSANIRQGMQPQLDALNRAVRRYEKRQAAQSIQVEARFQELDARLNDALSLAAAAARSGQRPGLVSMVFTWTAGILSHLIQACLAVATYPFRTAAALALTAQLWLWPSKPEREPRKRTKAQSNGYSAISTPRVQSRSGR